MQPLLCLATMQLAKQEDRKSRTIALFAGGKGLAPLLPKLRREGVVEEDSEEKQSNSDEKKTYREADQMIFFSS